MQSLEFLPDPAEGDMDALLRLLSGEAAAAHEHVRELDLPVDPDAGPEPRD